MSEIREQHGDHKLKKGSSFLEKGFLCEGSIKNSNRIQKKYAREFRFLSEASYLFIKITNLLNEKNSSKERVSKILAYKSIQSMQSCIILMKTGINSDTFSLIRTIHECFLAFVCLLKDEDKFNEMGDKDNINFRHKRIKDIYENEILEKMYCWHSESLSKYKKELDQSISEVKGKKKFGVGSFYEEVSDEPACQYIYYCYCFISNLHSHVSYPSMEKFLSDNKVSMNEASVRDVRMASSMLIEISMIFARSLSKHFLEENFYEEIDSITRNSLNHFIKVEYIKKG